MREGTKALMSLGAVFAAALAACEAPSEATAADADPATEVGAVHGAAFTPAPPPTLVGEGSATQPAYVFLFTHTEDPFNQALSDARYPRTAAMLQRIARRFPESHPSWLVQLQGSDAAAMASRPESAAVVAELRDLAAEGLVDFGYHGHHDPTYLNRPQLDLDAGSCFETIAAAFDDWVSCARDVATGECLVAGAGGIVAIAESFGAVRVTSGLVAGDEGEGPFEDGGGRWAIRRRAPEVEIGFGFSDHGPKLPDYDDNVRALMTLMTPAGDTSAGLFWADDALRINDGNPLDEAYTGNLQDGAGSVARGLAPLSPRRIQIVNAGLASKWIYARTSPTAYGYAHPGAPDLPPAQRCTDAEIDANYAATEDSLAWLAGTWFASRPGSRFIGADELLAIAAPDAYREVTADELDAIARWLLGYWGETPPSWASDGVEYYSLRDALGLLARALAGPSVPTSQRLTRFYGPTEAVAPSGRVRLTARDVQRLASEIAGVATASVPDFAADPDAWTETPPNLLPSDFAVGARRLNAAQALYALATLYASIHAGAPVAFVDVPDTAPMPESYPLYEALGCVSCQDTAWSSKPARLRRLD